MKAGNNYRGIVLPDLHAPFTRPDYWEWVCQQTQDFRPDFVIQLGDWIDADAVSSHLTEKSHDIGDEYREVARQSAEIRACVSNECRLWRLVGNHDWRLEPDAPNAPKRLREAIYWRNYRNTSHLHHIQDEWSEWTTVPYLNDKRGVLRLGQLMCWHGFSAAKTAYQTETLRMWGLTGSVPYTLGVSGHTHCMRGVQRLEAGAGNPYNLWYANPGTGGPLKPSYSGRWATHWGGGLLKVELRYDRPSRLRGKAWEAQMEEFDERVPRDDRFERDRGLPRP